LDEFILDGELQETSKRVLPFPIIIHIAVTYALFVSAILMEASIVFPAYDVTEYN